MHVPACLTYMTVCEKLFIMHYSILRGRIKGTAYSLLGIMHWKHKVCCITIIAQSVCIVHGFKATIMTTKKSFLTEIIFSNNEQDHDIS